MLNKKKSASIIGLCFLLLFSSCSPLYIARAGWEESKILWNKEPIDKVLDGEVSDELRKTLTLVLDVREFAKTNGLNPVSYTHLTLPTICSV